MFITQIGDGKTYSHPSNANIHASLALWDKLEGDEETVKAPICAVCGKNMVVSVSKRYPHNYVCPDDACNSTTYTYADQTMLVSATAWVRVDDGDNELPFGNDRYLGQIILEVEARLVYKAHEVAQLDVAGEDAERIISALWEKLPTFVAASVEKARREYEQLVETLTSIQ